MSPALSLPCEVDEQISLSFKIQTIQQIKQVHPKQIFLQLSISPHNEAEVVF